VNCLTEQELEQIARQDATISDEAAEHLRSCADCSGKLSAVKANLGFETDLLKMARQDDGIEMKPTDRGPDAGKRRPESVVPELDENRYEAPDTIGRGGMGTVYVTRDRDLRRDVAMKTTLYASDISDPKAQRFMERPK